jgi:hypothetical protein
MRIDTDFQLAIATDLLDALRSHFWQSQGCRGMSVTPSALELLPMSDLFALSTAVFSSPAGAVEALEAIATDTTKPSTLRREAACWARTARQRSVAP